MNLSEFKEIVGFAGNKTMETAVAVKDSFLWNVFDLLKNLALFITILCLTGIIVYAIIKIYQRNKQNQNLREEQLELLRIGKINVKKNKLRYLFSSVGKNKVMNEGRIVGYTEIEEELPDKTKKDYSIFIVMKSPIKPLLYFKVDMVEEDELIKDVVIGDWNFIKDDTGMFLIPNKLDKINTPEITDEDKTGVNTLKRMAPAIKQSVKNNPWHIKRMRESKLIKLGGSE